MTSAFFPPCLSLSSNLNGMAFTWNRVKHSKTNLSYRVAPYVFPQNGVPGIRHSTFESLRVGHSSQSIALTSSLMGFPELQERQLFDNFQVIANTNLELPDVVGQIRSVQGSDLSKETT
uniref:Uncharacterized protein n=1 Tax=Brassica oleracea var. oleracea TaxID=109376 RepID=A0A0D3E862_BRAOL